MADNYSAKSKGIWQEALSASRRVLGDDDFEMVQRYKTAEQMLDEVQRLERKYTKSAVPRLLKGLKPQLHHFQAFVTLVMISVGLDTIGVACIWGTIYLLIELASHSESALSRISFYLKDLGEKLSLFEEYNKSLDADPELMASFFELLVDLVLDCAAAIKHFRKNDIQVAITMATWNKIDEKFCKTLQELANKIDHLKKIIEARQLTKLTSSQTELIQALNRYNISGAPSGSTMSLPYFQLPFGRNPAFFGRSSVLREMQNILENADTARSIRSVAIWGTGGIGKSQVALEYANVQLTRNQCKFILW